MTIGDVLAIIALILSVAATWAAIMITLALAFPRLVGQAETAMLARPKACFLRGVGITLVVAVLASALGKSPGPIRLVAYTLVTLLGLLAATGSAAAALFLGNRIQQTGTEMARFACGTRGAILLVMSWLFPIFGWFIVFPASLLLCIGGAAQAFWPRRKSVVDARDRHASQNFEGARAAVERTQPVQIPDAGEGQPVGGAPAGVATGDLLE